MGGKVPHAVLSIKGCFSTLAMQGDERQHKEEMVAAATAPLFLARLLPVSLPTAN